MADSKGRRDEPMVFFVYDHNMLKKEEDDLKDAILYFSPEDVDADDQCALCGQLMGMSEFLGSTLSKAAPQMYRFEHKKFALKRFGCYSLALQGWVYTPDTLLKEQLKRLYDTFVTFHGSIDSLRLRFKESHSEFIQELRNICRTILGVSGIGGHSSLPSIFGAVPYVQLPKSGAHLFLQASHLLQSSQRRPYVMAGAILYKNGVLSTQLSPGLTKQLTFLQNQMPHIARTTEFDLPVGCRIVTLFLTDKEIQEICPLDYKAKRHCKMADFRKHRDKERTFSDASSGRKAKRRLTCPDLGSLSIRGKTGDYLSEKALKNFLRNEQRKPYQLNQDAMGVDQMSWRKHRPDGLLSHVPIVECQSGESPVNLESEVLGHAAKDSHFGHCYTEVDVNTGGKEEGEASETDDSKEDVKSQPALASHPVENEFAQTDNVVVSDRETLEKNEQPEMDKDQSLEPTISDLEDNLESENDIPVSGKEKNSFISYGEGSNKLKLSRNAFDTAFDSSLDDDEMPKSNFINSDDRTVTLTQDSHHAVLHHKVDVHVEASETAGDREKSDAEDGYGRISKDSLGNSDNNCRIESGNIDQAIRDDDNDEDMLTKHSGSAGTENVRGEYEHNFENSDEIISEKSQSECDFNNEPKTEVEHNKHVLENSDKQIPDQILQTMEVVTESSEILVSNSDETSMKNSKTEIPPQTEITDESERENGDQNDNTLQVNIDIKEESEIETEDERVDINNENPCISCLEAASQNGVNGNEVNNVRCSQCMEKHSSSIIFGKNSENQEVIDFREKSRDRDSGTEMEDQEKGNQAIVVQEATNDAKDTYEGFITSSFSSDVSTDSTISRYWTQEMDGLNDLTLYVQCHSDISLLLIMENPEKYQENLFHALWKGSLAQLADLDYYIKECLDSEEEETKPENYSYARYDNFTNNLTGTMMSKQQGGRESMHLHRMMATLHAEFELHQCLSDVCLRSQFSACYGHQNPVDETFFQIDGQQKLTSGLPLPRDPLFGLELSARSRLSKDRKLSMI